MGGCLKAIGAGVVLFLVFLVVVAVVGGGSRPGVTVIATAPAASQKPGATVVPGVGAVVTGRNWTYQVTAVERLRAGYRDRFGYERFASEHLSTNRRPVGVWLAVFMTLTNTGKENFPINSWDFELYDHAGVKYSADVYVGAEGEATTPGLTALGRQMPPGVQVHSVVAFDIAADARGLRLWLAQERTYVELGRQGDGYVD